MLFKIGVFKNFAIFTGKHLYWSLFLIKLQAVFYRTPLLAASVFSPIYSIIKMQLTHTFQPCQFQNHDKQSVQQFTQYFVNRSPECFEFEYLAKSLDFQWQETVFT